MSHDHPEDDSTISPISLPTEGFQSRIPASLLKGKTPDEIYVYTEVSKMSHFIDWAAPLMVDSNSQQRKTNGRVNRLEIERADRESVKKSWRSVAHVIASYVGFAAALAEGLWYIVNLHGGGH